MIIEKVLNSEHKITQRTVINRENDGTVSIQQKTYLVNRFVGGGTVYINAEILAALEDFLP